MPQPEFQAPATTIPDALGRIDQSWQVLQAEIAAIPDNQQLEPDAVGVWSVKDLMGHIAFWDAVAIDKINRELGRPAPPLDDDATWANVNEREAAKRADRSLAENRDEMTQIHERLLATLQSLGTLDPQVEAAICGGLPEDTDAHYAGHLDDLRRWRERAGRT